VGRGYGDGGDGCGFGAEDAGAESYGLPVMLREEGDFFRGPAAFGAYGDGVGDSRTHVRISGPFDKLRAGCGAPGLVVLQSGG
jgi:hypothetical protein